jgi:two-component system response regulator AtoC
LSSAPTGRANGVGARRLHQRSLRADAAFLCLNCAAFSESLLESELFGFERGAFTGATQPKPGLLESAEGGTVLLDEIGEMPPALQAKLLRVIEQREVLRVGALKPRPIDVRFLAATHKDLDAEIKAGRFRSDLFFRLHGVTVTVPPLRERVHEIEPLARAFLAEACAEARRTDVPDIAPSALAFLKRHAWPGNIRELRNTIERAAILCAGSAIELSHLPGADRSGTRAENEAWVASLYAADPSEERARILDALARSGGNQTAAAKLLGVARRTLVTRLGKHGLPRPRRR